VGSYGLTTNCTRFLGLLFPQKEPLQRCPLQGFVRVFHYSFLHPPPADCPPHPRKDLGRRGLPLA